MSRLLRHPKNDAVPPGSILFSKMIGGGSPNSKRNDDEEDKKLR